MAFLKNSRYVNQAVVQTQLSGGEKRDVIKLRRIPPTTGSVTPVRDGETHDLLAEQHFQDATRFWHLADANTELEARRLVERSGGFLRIPRP